MRTIDQAPTTDTPPPLKLSHQILSGLGFLGVREVADYDAHRPFRPQRAKEALNVIHASKRGARLQQPDPELIKLVEHEEPKVRYFPVASTDEFKESRVGYMNSRGYEHNVLYPLHDKIREDFPDQLIYTRTTHVSINGSVRMRDMVLMDAVDAARLGEERGAHRFGTVWTDTSKPMPHAYYPFKDYVGELTELRERLSKEGRANDVFPALIVYDPDLTERAGYTTHITGSSEDAVLGLYILDAPLITPHPRPTNTHS